MLQALGLLLGVSPEQDRHGLCYQGAQCPGLEYANKNLQRGVMNIMGPLNRAVKEIQLSNYKLPTSVSDLPVWRLILAS